MKSRDSSFDFVHLLYYMCHQIKLNCGRSYIDSPDWIKNRKIYLKNPVNHDNKCYQYAGKSCTKL